MATKVIWHEDRDTFDVRELSRYQANMLQRALQPSPYDEIQEIRSAVDDALARAHDDPA